MRGRLDDRGRVAGRDHRPQRAPGAAGASGVVACASFGSWTPPMRVAAVPIIPVRMPAASSAATARNEVVVLPSVPVIPTTASSWLGSPYHHAAAVASAGRACRRRRAAAARRRGAARSTSAAAAPARGGRGDEVVAVDVQPGDGHEQRSRRGPRANRGSRRGPRRRPARAGPIARPSLPRAAQATLGRQPLDQPAERGRLGRFGARRGGRRCVGSRHRPSHPRQRAPASRPAA